MNATCPNCENPVDFEAPACPKCGALFSTAGRKPQPRAEGAAPAQAPADQKKPSPVRYIGYALIAAALGVPMLMGNLAGLSGYSGGAVVGGMLGRLVMTWLVLALIAGILTRKSSARVKGLAVVVVGVLLLIGSVTISLDWAREQAAIRSAGQELKAAVAEMNRVIADANSPATAANTAEVPASQRLPGPGAAAPPVEPGVPGFIRAMALMLRQGAVEANMLNHKIGAIDLSDVLTAPNLASAASIARSRDKLARYEALVGDHVDYLNRTMARGESIITQSQVPQQMRLEALKGYYAQRDLAVPVYHALEKTSRATLASAGAVLDFAERNLSQFSLVNGKLTFRKRPQLEQFRALLAQVAADANNVTAAQEKFLALQRESAKRLDTVIGEWIQ